MKNLAGGGFYTRQSSGRDLLGKGHDGCERMSVMYFNSPWSLQQVAKSEVILPASGRKSASKDPTDQGERALSTCEWTPRQRRIHCKPAEKCTAF